MADEFTATGPAQSGSGFPFSAFSSKATGMVYGVNVQGDKAGVYGESVGAATDRQSPIERVGVCGVGDMFGVLGMIHRRPGNPGLAGVIGQHKGAGVGMIGAALTLPDGRGGIGVAGISHTSLNTAEFVSLPDPARGSGTGVFGTSGKGLGFGARVRADPASSARAERQQASAPTAAWACGAKDRLGREGNSHPRCSTRNSAWCRTQLAGHPRRRPLPPKSKGCRRINCRRTESLAISCSPSTRRRFGASCGCVLVTRRDMLAGHRCSLAPRSKARTR